MQKKLAPITSDIFTTYNNYQSRKETYFEDIFFGKNKNIKLVNTIEETKKMVQKLAVYHKLSPEILLLNPLGAKASLLTNKKNFKKK